MSNLNQTNLQQDNVTAILCEGDHTAQLTLGDALERWTKQPHSNLWLDISGTASSSVMHTLMEHLALSQEHLREAMLDRHPPNVDHTDQNLYILLKPLDAESNGLDFSTQQLAIFLGERFIVTRHGKHSPYLEKLQQQAKSGQFQMECPKTLGVLLLRRMIRRYGDVLLNLESRLDIVEDDILNNPSDKYLQELVSYKTSLRKMRRILNYHHSVAKKAHNFFCAASAELAAKSEDVIFELDRFNSMADMYLGVVHDLIEGYISYNGHQLNQVMRVLTVVTVLFLPLSLLVGIYGMNFEYIPELKSHNGYFVLLGVMGFIVAALVLVFRHKKWL